MQIIIYLLYTYNSLTLKYYLLLAFIADGDPRVRKLVLQKMLAKKSFNKQGKM